MADVEKNHRRSGSDTTLPGADHHEQPSAPAITFNQPTFNEASDPVIHEKTRGGSKVEITQSDCYKELGFCFSNKKKWYILTVVFWVQVSMNFNTSLYNNAVPGMTEEFGISEQLAKCGAMIFLVLYAFGCELWAPWSEEFGRWPVLQASLLLVNIWQIPVALAKNFETVMVGRALGGLSTAGGSVTLGLIADMFEPEHQQYAVAYIVFSSVGGSVLGPIVGGFSEKFLHWRWSIWIQLILGVVVQAIHFFTVPETRVTIMMNRIAKKRREADPNLNLYGPDEITPFKERFSAKEILQTWVRPFRMFLTEPIVLVLSLLSGFADALIFMFIHAFGTVYSEMWDFNEVAIGLTFIAIGIGYAIAWAAFLPSFKRGEKQRRDRPEDERAQYESRLWFLLYTAPCLPLGLLGFAFVVRSDVHWIASMIFAAIVGIANYAIYMATIDYMICAYGPYSASATGGNGWARDFLAGVLVIPSGPFFHNIGHASGNNYRNATLILFGISSVLVAAVYVIYWKGPVLRKRSPFAQALAGEREQQGINGGEGTGARKPSMTYSQYSRRRSSAAPPAETGEDRRPSRARLAYAETERRRSSAVPAQPSPAEGLTVPRD